MPMSERGIKMTRTEKIVENSKKNIEKLKGVIAKHQARKEKLEAKMAKMTDKQDIQWVQWDIESCEDDIANRMKDLAAEQEKLQRWEEKLKIEQQKDVCPVKAIEDFLLNWKEKARAYYMKEAQEYIDEYHKYRATLCELSKTKGGYTDEYQTAYNAESKRFQNWRKAHVSVVTERITNVYKKVIDTETLETIIHQEKVRKAESLMNRVTEMVGEITDASGLYVAENLELNGKVIGTKGAANVVTIYAGGYNIQCLHFRVLVHLIK